ncbi:heparinase II/III family protein [Chitinophaga sp.]|uniref:heparinase II/III domain-containing protein n=1 Tax=Chitinophaga sp. TaxID=1869181 RepID=UPI0031DAC76D
MRSFFCWTIVLLLSLPAVSQDLLSSKYTTAQLSQQLIPRVSWIPFPPAGDTAWTADKEVADAAVRKAERYLHYEWPGIPATTSLLIVRTGNRSDYQAIANRKREALATLLLAEIYEHKGRFIDDIINGVWSVCEESFWGASAHLPKGDSYAGLPDVADPFVELFSAETATLLAWVDYYVGSQLDAVSPQVRKRIYYETNRRIFEPLATKHHSWMGNSSSTGRRPNNWNPWICSNWLNAVLLLERDEHKRAAAVQQVLRTLDNFLNPYPADGGCDEGPGYWGAAAASLYDNISLLDLATHGAFSYVFQDTKVKKMAQFIYLAQISERYFLDFADADPQPGMDGMMIYRFGKAIGDPDMMRFGAFYYQDNKSAGTYHFFRQFFARFMQQEVKAAAKGLPLPRDTWWPDLQVMAARDRGGSAAGFYVAVKGGNNDESHNHNDIGNFIVYHNGLPVIIDVGRGTYTARTFSSKRYDIWFNRSDYHNLPDVNGYTQLAGARYKATDAAYQSAAGYSRMSMDIAAAYPEQAGIRQWRRSVRLDRGRAVHVTDSFALQAPGTFRQYLMTCYPVDVSRPGQLQIQDFVVTYPAGLLEASVEKVHLQQMEDEGIRQKWGDNIYRIILKAKAPVKEGEMELRITNSGSVQ